MKNQTEFEDHLQQGLQHFHRELESIRTGRANPALIEHLPVAAYGTVSPLQQLAAIQTPEPRLLVVQPWDPGLIKDIEKALQQSNLGITPVVDGKIIRLPFPPMTADRRQQLVKVIQEKAEQARVSIRNSREQAMKKIRNQEQNGELSEDAAAAAAKNIQAALDEAQRTIAQRATGKVEEVTTL